MSERGLNSPAILGSDWEVTQSRGTARKEPQCLMSNPPEMHNPPFLPPQGAVKAAGTKAVAQQPPPELSKPRSRDNNELMCSTSAKLQLISALILAALPAIQISS